MILVDTSVWVDHLRRRDGRLVRLLEDAEVLAHPLVIGEIACGNLVDRAEVLGYLRALPEAPVAEFDETLAFIERNRLAGKGIGFVDASLLASVALVGDARLWTRDRRLHAVASTLGAAFDEAGK